jgi:hypothetical protein
MQEHYSSTMLAVSCTLHHINLQVHQRPSLLNAHLNLSLLPTIDLLSDTTQITVFFTSKLFKDACQQQHQRLTLCGVDAHHQNGIAERYIRTITERARTMLIHAMINWPDIITEDLWPFAIQLAVDLHNMTPTSSDFSPQEIFSGTKQQTDPSNCHTFGCPIYVLEPTLRQNHKLPRWKPRSRVGVYLGFSPHHSSRIPLVLSTTTGLVSPQYHVVFDDNFSTVNSFIKNQIPPIGQNFSSKMPSHMLMKTSIEPTFIPHQFQT